MAERHTKGGDPRSAVRLPGFTPGPPDGGQSPMTRAAYGLEFKPYVYGGVTAEPEAVTAAREYHREVSGYIARRAAALDERAARDRAAVARLEREEADPGAECWEWLNEQRGEEAG